MTSVAIVGLDGRHTLENIQIVCAVSATDHFVTLDETKAGLKKAPSLPY